MHAHRIPTLPNRRRRRIGALAGAIGLTMALPVSTLADHGFPNPDPYVALTAPVAAAGGEVIGLINSGDLFADVTFEGIPDGIGVVPGDGTIDLFVTHEQSHVPFDNDAGGPQPAFADFQDSSVSRVTVDIAHRQVTGLEVALSPELGFIRFCSAFMAGPEHGFADYTFFANEESNDVITVPAGAPYGADPSIAPFRQAGYAVALNTESGAVTTLTRMGRHNHENTVVVPGGWKEVASLSSDDTFTAPSSQLYLHTAQDARKVMSDKGQLWAFQVTATDEGVVDPFDPFNDANDFLEINVGDDWSGRFIHVPTDIARGITAEQPQAGLENWSNANNVFQFVRVEDLAYDPDDPRTVYFTDTGTTRLAEDPDTGRLERLASGGVTSRGRVFKMVLNEKDPRIVDSFSVLAEASSLPEGGMDNPDNLDVGHSSIMVQEDAANARVWRYDLATGMWSWVATAIQPTAETSGIVDVSDWFGPGWWALDVQSHVNESQSEEELTYVTPITGVEIDYFERREDGQLLLMKIPGS